MVSLARYLTPGARALLERPKTREKLSNDGLVVLRSAIVPQLADPVHLAISRRDDWQTIETFRDRRLFYRYRYLAGGVNHVAELRAVHSVFSSVETRSLISSVAGEQCGPVIDFGATRYLPGDNALPHTDHADRGTRTRKVAFIWYMTRGWKPEWGGELYWLPTDKYVTPEYSTLVVFRVSPRSFHLVTPVAPAAEEERLAVTGWWAPASSR